MAAKSTGWVLWSRTGYRGPAENQAVTVQPEEAAAPVRTSAAPAPPQSPGSAQARQPRQAPPVPMPHLARGGTEALIDAVLRERSVEIEYQAVFDATRGQVVGFEALARGPEGPLRSPMQLFGAARAAGRVGELDWVCRAAAFRGMLAANLPPSISLFVNVEPDSLIQPCPEDLLETVGTAEAKLRVFVDVAGPAMSRYPCQVLETVRLARAAKWGVAVTDIEYSMAGRSLLPTIEPDVVKLKHNLLTIDLSYTSASIVAALAESEQTRAAILVERVEDERAAMIARTIGGTYQQGRLLGREGPLPGRVPPPLAPLPLLHVDGPTEFESPWRILTAGGAHRTANVDQAGLDHLIRTVANQACAAEQPPVIASISPQGADLPAETRSMFHMLLERCPLIIIVGPDVAGWADWRVRAADLPTGHPLGDESCFLALSSSAALVVAAHRQEAARGGEPRWDVAVSQSPKLCRQIVRHMLGSLDTLAGGVFHGRVD
jgi:EAL domain-containing protein (putative c-di-GMP-specific phosphodiesterase class I)